MAVGLALLAETLSIEEERVMARPRQYGCVWQSPAARGPTSTARAHYVKARIKVSEYPDCQL